MAYTKNHDPWASSDPLTTAALDNFETIYTEVSCYLASHNHDALYQTKAEMEAAYWYPGNDGPGSGSDADLIYSSSGNLHSTRFVNLGVPVGLIIMWSGDTLPDGWRLCDGTNGTYDLRGKFVIGAGNNYAPGANATGAHTPAGSVTVAGHSLTAAEVAGHQHTYQDRAGWGGTGPSYTSGSTPAPYPPGAFSTQRTTGDSSIGKAIGDPHSHTASFVGNEFTATPPYYALAFIQKV
jgi:hypothetical protein